MNTRTLLFACIVGILVIFMLSVGCTLEDWEYTWARHGVGDQYDGQLSFELLQTRGSFDPRQDHASAIFDDAIWIFGGYNPHVRGDQLNYLSDVWKSEDGYTWQCITTDAPWKGRRGHQVVVFEDALYLIGGYRVHRIEGTTYGKAANDVWKSEDGVTWEEIKPDSYKTRVTHPNIPLTDDVRGEDLYNPIDDKDWYPRLHHSVAILDGKMVLFGGYAKEWMPYLNDGNRDQTRRYFADMWSSTDGIAWTQMDPMTLGDDQGNLFGQYTAGRSDFASFIHDGDLYMLGGTSWFSFQEYSSGFVVPNWDRFWKLSSDGWEAIGPYNQEYIDRRGHQIVEYNGAYWILPGSKPAAIQWYKGADSLWKITINETLEIQRDGSQRAGSPMYGISHYTAEVFTPTVGIHAGQEAIYVLCGDGDGGVRNSVWRVTDDQEDN